MNISIWMPCLKLISFCLVSEFSWILLNSPYSLFPKAAKTLKIFLSLELHSQLTSHQVLDSSIFAITVLIQDTANNLLTPAPLTFWTIYFLVKCPVYCRVFSSIPSHDPLDVSRTLSCDNECLYSSWAGPCWRQRKNLCPMYTSQNVLSYFELSAKS